MPITNGYCSRDEAKQELQIATTSTSDDNLVDIVVEAVSRWIDSECGRNFYQSAAQTRTYVATNRYLLDVDDIALNSGITIKSDPSGNGTFPTTWQATDFQLLPQNAPFEKGEPWPWTQIRAVGTQTFPLPYTALLARRDRVQVTATFGWPATPMKIKQACILMSARQFKRRSSPEGVAGFGDLGAVRVTREDVDVLAMIHSLADGENAPGLAFA